MWVLKIILFILMGEMRHSFFRSNLNLKKGFILTLILKGVVILRKYFLQNFCHYLYERLRVKKNKKLKNKISSV